MEHGCQIRINGELSLTKGNNSRRHDAIWAILKPEHIMVLNNVTKFHKILIKIFELESGHRLNSEFHKKSHNYLKPCAIWTIIEFEEDIKVLNNVTKCHKILIKNI